MNLKNNHSIQKQILLILLLGLFTMIGHPLVHALKGQHAFPEPSQRHELPRDNGANEKHDECPECILVSFLNGVKSLQSIMLPEKPDLVTKEFHVYDQNESVHGFLQRGPPSLL